MSYLDPHHIKRIHQAYLDFKDQEEFSSVIKSEKVLEDNHARLSVQLYVKDEKTEKEDFSKLLIDWNMASKKLKESMIELFKTIEA